MNRQALLPQRLPVVVVTNEGPGRRLRRCVASLQASGDAHPIVVVDNSDATESMAEQYGPGVDEVLRTANDGYGAAANAGFNAARALAPAARSVALLNDDVEVEPGWLTSLSCGLSDGVDVVQPKLLRGSPSATRVINSLGVRLDQYGAGVDVDDGVPDGPTHATGRDITIFTGGAVLFSNEFLDATGGFDERFFMYYEDVDLALRGRELGMRYRCEASAVVWHVGGASARQSAGLMRRFQERNRLWCAFRFAQPSTIARAVWLSVRRFRHAPRRIHAHALAAGLAAAPRLLVERWSANRSKVAAA